jgi:hypothetical protein
MALVVAVHGIGQQFKADTVIHSEWWPSLLGGLHPTGKSLSSSEDLSCAFYGNLFRKPGAMSGGGAAPSGTATPRDLELLQYLWQSAANTDPNLVPSPAAFQSAATLAATPQFVQRALNALARSPFCAGIAQKVMLGNLRQVVLYLDDPVIRAKAVDSVRLLIKPDTRVVVGHSLGSVVAYEALCKGSENVVSFVTIGSPLGIPNLIFEQLRPAPSALHIGHWPGNVEHWTNIADRGDIVANPKELRPLFGDPLKDLRVNNGSDAHHGERYLTAIETATAIAQGLP